MELIRKTYLAAALLALIASFLGANTAWGEAVPDVETASVKDGADCYFVDEPRIECRESPAEGGARTCWIETDVRNRGNKAAQHAHIMCVTRHRDTGELAQLSWRRIGFGLLRASGEKDIKAPYEEPAIPERDRQYEYSVLWKDRGFPNTEAERCEIAEKVVVRQEAKEGNTAATKILGFIVNAGEKSGFAPRLMAKITDERGEVVRSVFANTPQFPLDPGEKLPFIIMLPPIQENLIDNITLEFESEDSP